MKVTMKDDPGFWEWLRNRNYRNQPACEERLQVELELTRPPLPVNRKSSDEEVKQGVCVIEVF